MTGRLIRAATVAAGLLLLSAGRAVHACQSCFGAEDSPLIDGARSGVWVLIGVTIAMQGAFGGFFLYLRRRAKLASEQQLEDEWSELQRKDDARCR